MFCGSCGRKIKEQAKFCPYCGQPVRTETEQNATPFYKKILEEANLILKQVRVLFGKICFQAEIRP